LSVLSYSLENVYIQFTSYFLLFTSRTQNYMKTSSTLNLIKLVIPIDDLHAVFCQQPVVEPEPDIESSAKVEQQPEHITLSTQKTKTGSCIVLMNMTLLSSLHYTNTLSSVIMQLTFVYKYVQTRTSSVQHTSSNLKFVIIYGMT